MSEITWHIDRVTGALLVEGMVIEETSALAGDLLSPPRDLHCARPLTMHLPPAASNDETASGPCVHIAGYYHNSLIEGPGRRSTAKFQGCAIRCRGFIYSVTVINECLEVNTSGYSISNHHQRAGPGGGRALGPALPGRSRGRP